MTQRPTVGERLPLAYAGGVIVLVMILGGGTSQGLWTDHLIEIALLPALFAGLARIGATRLAPASRVLAIAVLVLLAVQFMPVVRPSPLPALYPSLAGWSLSSPAPQKSLEAALFTIGVLGFTLFAARLADRDQERCVDFMLLGLVVNLIAGILQFSHGRQTGADIGLPFTVQAGFFANENHFSSLIYMMIPVFAWRTLAKARQPLLFAGGLLVMLAVLFAAGSRAGMAIATTLAVVSLLWFAPARPSRRLNAAVLLVGVFAIAVIAWQFGFGSAIEGDLRMVFYRTTLRAIADHWLFGSGLGTFTFVYPAYQHTNSIVSVYANHAHDEYLEIWLETGIAGLALITAFAALLAGSFARSRLAEAAFISVVAVMLHSLVDYPLRTFAIAIPFGWFCAVILSVRPHTEETEASLQPHTEEEFGKDGKVRPARRPGTSRHRRKRRAPALHEETAFVSPRGSGRGEAAADHAGSQVDRGPPREPATFSRT